MFSVLKVRREMEAGRLRRPWLVQAPARDAGHANGTGAGTGCSRVSDPGGAGYRVVPVSANQRPGARLARRSKVQCASPWERPVTGAWTMKRPIAFVLRRIAVTLVTGIAG